MILTDPIIFQIPLHVWLGMVLAFLVIFQMLVGAQIIKLNHRLWHQRIIPILILLVLAFHFWYGFQIYFLKH
jgi:hypothetical protein